MAECHPVGFQWVTEAKLRGARVIHVDPRFTRTSAQADRHIPLRAGSDIALLGALINYVLTNDVWFHEYVLNYTNATSIIHADFQDTEDLGGIFSGYDPDKAAYDLKSWAYSAPDGADTDADGDDPNDDDAQKGHGGVAGADGDHTHGKDDSAKAHGDTHGSGGPSLETFHIKKDPTLQDPHCVLNLLRKHYARYTPEMVEEVCGISPEDFRYLAESIVENSGRERTTAFCYAVGWTHHTDGAQIIRTAAILQLLLGNVGRPGGGILALRGHASIQGSTDIPTLYNLLPGYLPMPSAGKSEDLETYLKTIGSKQQKGFWANADAYTVSLLKAYFGPNATAENEYGFGWLPRLTGAHGTYQTLLRMLDGKVGGYFVLGQNPAVGGINGRMQRKALAKLEWLVVRDLQLIETATFWKDSPEIATGELRTEEIGTEVFFLPVATHAEKAGTFTQTQRLLQWREKAVNAPGQCQSDLEFFYRLGQRIREKLKDSDDPRDRALQAITWDYPLDADGECDPEAVLAEINGYHVTGEKAGQNINSYTELKADGSTSCGCWIYAGVYADGKNHAANRVPGQDQNEIANQWGWAWPANRRVLYNRASADPDGNPWSERKKLLWWDAEAKRWSGDDVPDFPVDKDPHYRAAEDAGGADALDGTDAFVMMSDGVGWLFAPKGLVDGPLPTHYEPPESAVANPLYPLQASPTRITLKRADNLFAASADQPGANVYPYYFSTYRLTEHHTAGGMSRWLPHLAELQPQMFCEVSPELAAERALENGGWATIVSPRAVIEARVLVTERVRPVDVAGRRIHQIGLPYHWGEGDEAIVTGDSANDLLGIVLDPNVHIQETKVAACDIQPGRRPRGADALAYVEQYRRRAHLTTETGQTEVENLHGRDVAATGAQAQETSGDGVTGEREQA